MWHEVCLLHFLPRPFMHHWDILLLCLVNLLSHFSVEGREHSAGPAAFWPDQAVYRITWVKAPAPWHCWKCDTNRAVLRIQPVPWGTTQQGALFWSVGALGPNAQGCTNGYSLKWELLFLWVSESLQLHFKVASRKHLFIFAQYFCQWTELTKGVGKAGNGACGGWE